MIITDAGSSLPQRHRTLAGGLLLALVALAPGPLHAQDARQAAKVEPQKPMKDDNRILSTTTLNGQVVVVLPLTVTRIAPDIAADSTQGPWRGGPGTLLAADSLLSSVLSERAGAVQWVLPLQTKRVAKRAAGILPEADRMGQSVVHPQGLKALPDPLRASLRTLAPLVGGRYALIPGILILAHDTAGVRATYSAAIGDPRTGIVLWHTFARGVGANADAAMHAAFDTMLPPDPNAP